MSGMQTTLENYLVVLAEFLRHTPWPTPTCTGTIENVFDASVPYAREAASALREQRDELIAALRTELRMGVNETRSLTKGLQITRQEGDTYHFSLVAA